MKVYNYTFWLLRSLRLACASCVRNTVPVGCVANIDNVELVSSNNMFGVHAEVIVARKASYVLNTCNLVNILLFITLEPCFFCVTQLVALRFKVVFFGTYTATNENCFYLKCRFLSFNFFNTLLTYKMYRLLVLFFILRR
jgi:tRNA(Arg) A34 adenosine deaminase TadA